MDNQEKRRKMRHRSKKRAVIMLATATGIVWLVLLLVKIIVAYTNGDGLDFMSLLDGIWDNILGILPPIILIDFAFEFVTQDYVSEEISEQITGTLMSNPDTIRLFDDETKRSFLNATIDSLATNGSDEAEMAENAIAPYIQGKYNLKKYFNYNITLRQDPVCALFDMPEYLTVNETLCYEKYFLATEPLGETFGIGFFVSNSDLDRQLRGQTFLVREGLTVRPEELQKLCSLSDEDKIRFVANDMRLKVYIDRSRCEITGVTIDDTGIVVTLHSDHKIKENMAYIDVAFCMPRLQTERIFLAAITEPTYSVNIRFDYPRSIYKVEMFPFFNDTEDALVEEADRGVGSCDVNLRDKWVYPMSGIIFAIEPKT